MCSVYYSIHINTMKKILKFAAAFALSGAMLAGVGCQEIYDDIDDINAEIVEIRETDYNALSSKISDLSNDIAKLQKAYVEADAALKAELTKAITDGDDALKTSLEKKISDLEASFDKDLKALQTSLETESKKLADQISAVETDYKKADADIDAAYKQADAALAADILAAISKADKALADSTAKYALIIAGIDQKIATEVAAIYVAINTAKSELQGKIDDLSAALDAAKAAAKADDDKIVADLKAAKDDLEGKIAELNSTLNTKIEAAATKAANDLADAKKELLDSIDAAAAVAALMDIVIVAEFEEEIQNLENALRTKATADSTAAWAEINSINTDLIAKYQELVAEDSKLASAITSKIGEVNVAIDDFKSEYKSKVTELEAKDQTLTQDLAAAKSDYENKINNLKSTLEILLNEGDSTIAANVQSFKTTVNQKIDSVNQALAASIEQTLKDAKDYTDAQIEALELDKKFQAVNDTIAKRYNACQTRMDQIVADYTAAFNLLKTRIQSVVFYPHLSNGLISYRLGDKILSNAFSVFTGVLQVKPAAAAKKITEKNLTLYVRSGIVYNKQTDLKYASFGADNIEFIGEFKESNSDSGFVYVQALLPYNEDIMVSIGVAGYETESGADLQTCYEWIDSYKSPIVSTFEFWDDDNSKVTFGDTPTINKAVEDYYAVRTDGRNYIPCQKTYKPMSWFGSNMFKSEDDLEYVGMVEFNENFCYEDSLYVRYKLKYADDGQGINKNISFALADSTDQYCYAEFIAKIDTSIDANTTIGTRYATVDAYLCDTMGKEELMKKKIFALNATVNKHKWGGEYETYELKDSILWGWEKGSDWMGDTLWVKLDTTFYKVNDLIDNKTHLNLSKVDGTYAKDVNNIDLKAQNDSLRIIIKGVDFDSVGYWRTVQFQGVNGNTATNTGDVYVTFYNGPKPIVKGSTALTDTTLTPSVTRGGDFEIPFSTNIYAEYTYKGVNDDLRVVRDSTLAGFVGDHDHYDIFHDLENLASKCGKAKIIRKDTVTYKAEAFEYGKSYTLCFEKKLAKTDCRAEFEFDFDYSFNTCVEPFHAAAYVTDTLIGGKYVDGVYTLDSIPLQNIFKVDSLLASVPYVGDEKVTLKVSGAGLANNFFLDVKDGVIVDENAIINWPAPKDLKDSAFVLTATAYYGGSNGQAHAVPNNSVTCTIKTKEPIQQVVLDSLFFSRTVVIDTVFTIDANDWMIIDALDSNLFGSIAWTKDAANNFRGTIAGQPQFELNLSGGAVFYQSYDGGVTYNDQAFDIHNFGLLIDGDMANMSGNSLGLHITTLGVSCYKICVPYTVRHYLDNAAPNEHNGTAVLTILNKETSASADPLQTL